ncbi:MAG: TrkH family potassium uptake protein [Firmicutes bacterium]|nr:TrkH family potassium uptake protein [Bacillota bacterium]
MNLLVVVKVLGMLLLCEAVAMLPSLVVALIYGENTVWAFMISVLITASLGLLFFKVKVKENVIRYKEGFAIVTFGWLLASLMGSLPFLFTGALPSVVDALFETISGFTTTGSTVIQDLEVLPKSLLFWRSVTHWLGGMGILVLALAIQPALGVGTFQILKAESPGPISSKLTPRVSGTAKILYRTYLVITVVHIILLAVGGMPIFDSIIHAFGSVSTGGFSLKNASLGAYNNVYFEIVILIFMILSGINFSLYYFAFKNKNLRDFFHDTELKVYLFIIALYTIIITININGHVYHSLAESIRYAAFQVGSVITTTGYVTANFDLWPDLSKALIVTLMFVGACAGSTSGSIKVIRIHLVFKYIQREINRLVHPRAVKAIKINNVAVQENILTNVVSFFMLYILIFSFAALVLLTQNLDLVSAVTASAAAIGNIGPGLGLVGPSSSYAALTNVAKLLLAFLMIVGRLELYTVLSLLFPQTWKA